MRKPGFTLVELMVVVAIIVFLSALAIPKYFKYIAKAKQAEVALNLASLHTAQQLYFAEYGRYSANLSEVGWKPSGNIFYTYGFNTPEAQQDTHYFVGKLDAPVKHLKKTSANRNGFVAGAAADIAGNGKLDLWTIDEERNIKHVLNGIG